MTNKPSPPETAPPYILTDEWLKWRDEISDGFKAEIGQFMAAFVVMENYITVGVSKLLRLNHYEAEILFEVVDGIGAKIDIGKGLVRISPVEEAIQDQIIQHLGEATRLRRLRNVVAHKSFGIASNSTAPERAKAQYILKQPRGKPVVEGKHIVHFERGKIAAEGNNCLRAGQGFSNLIHDNIVLAEEKSARNEE